jgi:hypothetical protein
MKINYKLIKKIHLYACLSTVAVLLMFIFTSYLMIHHSWFDHEQAEEKMTVDVSAVPASGADWQAFTRENDIKGRLVRENIRDNGDVVREYARAAGSARITFSSGTNQAEIVRRSKSTADAVIGVHRQRGYGGPLSYSLYAFLLDVLGLGLIIFTITGIIMWFKLLKNSTIAWVIFISGFIYFGITMVLLVYW